MCLLRCTCLANTCSQCAQTNGLLKCDKVSVMGICLDIGVSAKTVEELCGV